MSAKRPRTIDSFFNSPPGKRSKGDAFSSQTLDLADASNHFTYPFPIPNLPAQIKEKLDFVPATEGLVINDQPDLDLLYFQPFILKEIQHDLFEHLRGELCFYRVKYMIKRGPVETQINTPRFTTVFGLDETARFEDGVPVDASSSKPLPKATYKCQPRPIPGCLDVLRRLTENATGCKFNFALVNYYASGDDSISYHSDDEHFLGPNPSIASFTLGPGKRDFLLRHKPTPAKHVSETKPKKFLLASGDMLLMRGATQRQWLHSIPKRKGGEADKGRINITFRRALVKGGTENYYRYNVGNGDEVYKWSSRSHEMSVWTPH